MKQFFLLALVFLLVGCGQGTEGDGEDKMTSTQGNKGTRATKKTAKTKLHQIDNQIINAKAYDAKIIFAPIRHPHPELIKRLEAMVKVEKQLFFESKGLEEVEKDPTLRKWQLHIETKPVYESETFSSFLISVYIDSGGAHGNGHYQVLNFDHKYGDSVEFTEVFDDQAILDLVSEQSIKELKTKLNDHDWIEEGAGPQMLNFQFWNYTPVGMLVQFPPYQVGPWAVGGQKVMIEKALLQPYLSRVGKRMWPTNDSNEH